MSCNGCRVLRKGCSDCCVLRTCLQWIDTAEAQGHATVFVAKFFGRAGLMSFISAVHESQRPALFQSLLFEACGRTINPVNGAVGLLWTGNWNLCQAAVETVLRGGTLKAMTEVEDVDLLDFEKKRSMKVEDVKGLDLDLSLTAGLMDGKRRPGTPSEEGSVTTCVESGVDKRPRLLNLFV